MVRRGFWMTVSVVCLSLAVWFGVRSLVPDARLMAAPRQPLVFAPAGPDPHTPTGEEERPRTFRVPSGSAPSLTCEDAHTIILQVRRKLAYAPDPMVPHAFATTTSDWLDPYGLWSVAPDSPVAAALEKSAGAMLAELEARTVSTCAAARSVGRALAAWTAELRQICDERRGAALPEDPASAAGSSPFEGATVSHPARELAAVLGEKLGAIERALGPAGEPYTTVARQRYFPDFDEDAWAKVVLAASVRAYVQLADPHGQWAPLDEEASVYDVDLEARPPARLWDKSTRTALGIRVDQGVAAPLRAGDIVLALADMPTAGLSQEQVEQLGFAAAEAKSMSQAIVMRVGEDRPLTLTLGRSLTESKAALAGGAPEDRGTERIAYGAGDVVVIAIKDVRDDLGDAVTRTLLRERERPGRALSGVVLDLRGNGGGSTDGAYETLGIFLPGAPLFPMKRRDGVVDPDRAPAPPNVDRWSGPVATLVDGDTASAAEMIAGALSSYRRGPSVGATTFGKGCAQEYDDDDAHVGVLRLTTLLYALPDGTPVQRIGLTPSIKLAFAPLGAMMTHEREATLAHAPPSWRGPDVRDKSMMGKLEDGAWSVAWPAHGGEVGACKDADVCRALRALGGGGGGKRIAKGRSPQGASGSEAPSPR